VVTSIYHHIATHNVPVGENKIEKSVNISEDIGHSV